MPDFVEYGADNAVIDDRQNGFYAEVHVFLNRAIKWAPVFSDALRVVRL